MQNEESLKAWDASRRAPWFLNRVAHRVGEFAQRRVLRALGGRFEGEPRLIALSFPQKHGTEREPRAGKLRRDRERGAQIALGVREPFELHLGEGEIVTRRGIRRIRLQQRTEIV